VYETEFIDKPVRVCMVAHAEILPSAFRVVLWILSVFPDPSRPPTIYNLPPNTTGLPAAIPPAIVLVESTHHIPPWYAPDGQVAGFVIWPVDEIAT
jgi:hypothetical protein